MFKNIEQAVLTMAVEGNYIFKVGCTSYLQHTAGRALLIWRIRSLLDGTLELKPALLMQD